MVQECQHFQTDHSKVDLLGSWYKHDNFGATQVDVFNAFQSATYPLSRDMPTYTAWVHPNANHPQTLDPRIPTPHPQTLKLKPKATLHPEP